MPRVFSKKRKRRDVDDDENNKVVWSSPKVSSLSDRLLEKYRRKKKKETEDEDEDDVDDQNSFWRRRRRLEIETDSPKKLKKENDVFARIHQIATSKKKKKKKTKGIEMYRLLSRNAGKDSDDGRNTQGNNRKISDRFETWGRSSKVRTRHKPMTTILKKNEKSNQNPRKLSDVLRRLGDRDCIKTRRSDDLDTIDDDTKEKKYLKSNDRKIDSLVTAKKNETFEPRERAVIVESSPSKKLETPSKVPTWKSKLANASMSTPQGSKQTPSPHQISSSRKGRRRKQTPRGKALKQAMKHCGMLCFCANVKRSGITRKSLESDSCKKT